MNAALVLQALKGKGRALLVVGPRESGKTSAILAFSAALQNQGISVDGVASPRLLQGGQTVGYKVRRVSTGEEHILCALEPPGLACGRFFFRPEAVTFANTTLKEAAQSAEVVVIDEVGPLELAGAGFFPGVQACLTSRAFLILSVRPHVASLVAAWVGDQVVRLYPDLLKP